jgi:F0F1-type ATP synthase assembly protein I
MAKYRKIIEGAEGLSLGISIVVAILLGVGIGYWLRDMFGYEWLFWLGVFWGVGGALLNIFKAYQKQKRDLEELQKDPRYKNYYDNSDDLEEFDR